VNRIAATVLQNIQRDMIRACRSQADLRRVTSSTVPEDLPDEREAGGGQLSASLLHADVERLIGDDATLVFRVALEGFTQAEVAVELGLSEEAARKRYQRAALRLRRAHEKNA
jgi:RNA polymerase sigma-70 factor (ECF subfamily)